MTEELGERLTQLGRQTEWPQSPNDARLEWVPNPHLGTVYIARFTCPEFTSICPVTGQPDFAHLVIDYVPKERLVESKSLKLFLGSFRNHGAFHEDCSLVIAKRLKKVLDPSWLPLGGYWYPRGGMPIDVFYQSGEPPKGVWLSNQGVAVDRRGRRTPLMECAPRAGQIGSSGIDRGAGFSEEDPWQDSIDPTASRSSARSPRSSSLARPCMVWRSGTTFAAI